MRVMVLERPGEPLALNERAVPKPGAGELLLEVLACGVCRTDLHLVDGELSDPRLPVVPGHEIVARVVESGQEASGFAAGDRVAVPWLAGTCGSCRFCLEGRENLCDRAVFTGYQRDGGYAEYTLADARYCFKLPGGLTSVEAAPLLCAGLIGWRAYKLAGEGKRLGLYGFGAAAHILIQVAIYQGREVYAFTRPGDTHGQAFARQLGAAWAGSSEEGPPVVLDAAIIFAPAGELVPTALEAVGKGGVVVCGGIHMSDIPSFPYRILWGERSVRSVANLTRADALEFLEIAPAVPVKTVTSVYPLEKANRALADLRQGLVKGAAVLVPESQGD
jgi:propanol-preferring alcohol dehydrogenase